MSLIEGIVMSIEAIMTNISSQRVFLRTFAWPTWHALVSFEDLFHIILTYMLLCRQSQGQWRGRGMFSLIIHLDILSSFSQLHSELVRTTILKDFVDFYGISKYVHSTAGVAHADWFAPKV